MPTASSGNRSWMNSRLHNQKTGTRNTSLNSSQFFRAIFATEPSAITATNNSETYRMTIPTSSSFFKSNANIRWEIPGKSRCKSPKRLAPSKRMNTSIIRQRPLIMSAAFFNGCATRHIIVQKRYSHYSGRSAFYRVMTSFPKCEPLFMCRNASVVFSSG